MEFGLEFVTIVGPSFANAERELFDDMINEVDRVCLRVFVIDLKGPEVIIMGGAFGFNGETGNMTPVAEANFYNDPHAADIVVQAKWPITVVGLDVTHQTLITPKDLQILREQSERYGAFISDISQTYMSFYQTKFGMPGFSIHDPSAVIYASSPHMFETRKGYLRVVPDGITKGQSILVPPDRNFLYNEWNSGGVHMVCEQVSSNKLLSHYIEILSNAGQSLLD